MRQFGQQSLVTLLSSPRPRRSGDISLEDFLEKKTKNPTVIGRRNGTGDAPAKGSDTVSPTAEAGSSCRENVLDSLRAQRTSIKKRVGSDMRKKRKQRKNMASATHLLVLGDELGRRPKLVREESNRSIFNHYADGNGWWEGDMVGLDPAVATCEWEGVGTMSFGDPTF